MENNENLTITTKNFSKGKAAFDAFLNLLSLITLGWLAHAFGTVCFQLINKNLGDINNYTSSSYYYGGMLKYGIASLLVITPVYFLAINLLHQQYKKGELNHESGIYKWLTYLMLLISSLAIIGSLITLITSFLNGNYTLPFILKILVVIIIAAVIFGYYLYDLNRKDYSKKDFVSLVVGSVVALSAIIAIIVGFLNVDSPLEARNHLEDSKIESALNQIYYYINNDYIVEKKLKDSYDFNLILNNFLVSSDKISYRKISDKEYELCADFKSKSQLIGDRFTPWFNHSAGRQCYTINAQTEYERLYKPIEKPAVID